METSLLNTWNWNLSIRHWIYLVTSTAAGGLLVTWIANGAPLSWLEWTWSVITMPVTIPLWLLLLGGGICVLLFPLSGMFYEVAFCEGDDENREPEWKKYREDLIFGIKWRWGFRNDRLYTPSLQPYCPNCEHDLKMDDWHCPNCDFQKNPERELGKPLSSGETLHNRVVREVLRRARTGEYEQHLEDN